MMSVKVAVTVHRPEPAIFGVLDSGRTWLMIEDEPVEVTMFFRDPTTAREWLVAALAEIDATLGLVRITP